MDISDINRIGKELEKLDHQPCCNPSGKENYKIRPSCLTFDHLVARPPFYDSPNRCDDFVLDPNGDLSDYNRCPNPNLSEMQRKAVDAFQIIYQAVLRTLRPASPSLHVLKQFAVCFDDFYFGGTLMPRCSIQWFETPQDPNNYAQMDATRMCRDHQQCQTTSISFNPTATYDINPHARSPRRLGCVLVSLLHELRHAWILIFGDKSSFSIKEVLAQEGFVGHGLAWEKLMHKCLKEGLYHFKLQAFELSRAPKTKSEDRVAVHIEEDECARRKLDELVNWIEQSYPGPEQIEERISETVFIRKEAAKYYHALIEKHFEPLEAVVILSRGPDIFFNWKNAGRHLPLPPDYLAIARPE